MKKLLIIIIFFGSSFGQDSKHDSRLIGAWESTQVLMNKDDKDFWDKQGEGALSLFIYIFNEDGTAIMQVETKDGTDNGISEFNWETKQTNQFKDKGGILTLKKYNQIFLIKNYGFLPPINSPEASEFFDWDSYSLSLRKKIMNREQLILFPIGQLPVDSPEDARMFLRIY